jgi:hypothetical protein
MAGQTIAMDRKEKRSNKMILLFCLQLGMFPANDFQMWEYSNYPRTKEIVEEYISIDFEFEVKDVFFFGGNIETDFFSRTWKNYIPTKMGYLFKAGLRFAGFELGFNHYCQHPVIPSMSEFYPGKIQFEGAYEKIYIQYSGKVDIF